MHAITQKKHLERNVRPGLKPVAKGRKMIQSLVVGV
jgi:hypothetical protein